MFCFCSFLACVSCALSLSSFLLPSFLCALGGCAALFAVPCHLLFWFACSPVCVSPFGGCSLFPPSRDVLAWFSEFFAHVSSRVSGCFLSVPYLVILSCSLPVWCSGSPGSPSSGRLMATKASALCGALPSPPCCVCRSGAWCPCSESASICCLALRLHHRLPLKLLVDSLPSRAAFSLSVRPFFPSPLFSFLAAGSVCSRWFLFCFCSLVSRH